MKQPKGETEQPEMVSVPADVLSEIRVTIHDSLEAAINLMLETDSDEYAAASALIRPAVERLARICEENKFPE